MKKTVVGIIILLVVLATGTLIDLIPGRTSARALSVLGFVFRVSRGCTSIHL